MLSHTLMLLRGLLVIVMVFVSMSSLTNPIVPYEYTLTLSSFPTDLPALVPILLTPKTYSIQLCLQLPESAKRQRVLRIQVERRFVLAQRFIPSSERFIHAA
jgi:hypothetical protein